MARWMTRRLRRLALRLGLERDWYMIVTAALIGLIMGGVATAFILPLHAVEEWADQADRSLLLWLIPIAPMGGALISALVIGTRSDGKGVPGVSSVMYAIHRQKSRIPLIVAVRKWIASTATIASGGSAGAEGPIVTIGSAIGSTIARVLKSSPQHTATFLGCAAAAGIASVFNAPIAGTFFVLEILLRDFSMRTFTPIIVASVVSAAWTQTILGEQLPLFLVSPDFFERGEHFTVIDIPYYVLLGIVCGIVAAFFIRSMIWTETAFDKLHAPRWLKPVLGAAALGAIGLAYMIVLGPAMHGIPPFYGNGYPIIKDLLDPQTYAADSAMNITAGHLLALLIMLAGLKAAATCLTIGSGGSGGLFAPSLLLGAAVGGAFGQFVNMLNWFPAFSPAHYALVGMAAMLAGTAHAPLTGILLVYEVTRLYEIILPLMLTAVISAIVGRLIFRESVYTFKLTQLGVRVGASSDFMMLRRLYVHDVPLTSAVLVHQDETAQHLLELSEKHLVRDFVVVDDKQQYVGMVLGDDLSAALVYREAIPLLQVQELVRTDLPTVTSDEPLDLVLDKFSQADAQSLAVLNNGRDRTVQGLITRSRLMERYQAALTRES